MTYEWIIQNRELLRFVYTFLLVAIFFVIVFKTDRLFRLSNHQGIRYFRNAFLFYGIAFVFRYALGSIYFSNAEWYPAIMRSLFEFFIIVAGFFLLYSLIWKRFENSKGSHSSLLNGRILLFYLFAFIIVLLDYLWKPYLLLFLSQIVIFFVASVIAYKNYKKSEKKTNFLKWYFIIMILNLVLWILNFVVAVFFRWDFGGVININILNAVIYLLFLYGILRVTKK